jgi:hypothetical protein
MRRRAEYDMPTIKPSAFFLLLLASGTGCTKYDPLYCDESMSCTDPARPYCDLAGEYPASDGVARTCIPSPFDAGMGTDAGGSAADGGAQPDARVPSDAASPCTWAPLSRLANVNFMNEAEYPGSVDSGGLTLLFDRAGTGPGDGFYVATRGGLGEAFGTPSLIDELSNDGVFRESPEVSSSGLEIFDTVVSGSSIERATRSTPTGTFGTPQATGLRGISPALSPDGLAMYFIGAGDGVVKVSTRTAIGEPWSSPITILPTTGYYGLDVSPDELRLLLTNNPFDPAPFPIAIASRASTDEEFGAPIPVNEEILVPDADNYSVSKWDATQTHMVVSVILNGEQDLYYSVCE